MNSEQESGPSLDSFWEVFDAINNLDSINQCDMWGEIIRIRVKDFFLHYVDKGITTSIYLTDDPALGHGENQLSVMVALFHDPDKGHGSTTSMKINFTDPQTQQVIPRKRNSVPTPQLILDFFEGNRVDVHLAIGDLKGDAYEIFGTANENGIEEMGTSTNVLVSNLLLRAYKAATQAIWEVRGDC